MNSHLICVKTGYGAMLHQESTDDSWSEHSSMVIMFYLKSCPKLLF